MMRLERQDTSRRPSPGLLAASVTRRALQDHTYLDLEPPERDRSSEHLLAFKAARYQRQRQQSTLTSTVNASAAGASRQGVWPVRRHPSVFLAS
jgi:hypothetical protein